MNASTTAARAARPARARATALAALLSQMALVVAACGGTAGEKGDAPGSGSGRAESRWERSLRVSIAAERTLVLTSTGKRVCFGPIDVVYQQDRHTLAVVLKHSPDDTCRSGSRAKEVRFPLPAGVDIDRIDRALVLDQGRIYPPYPIHKAARLR